MNFGAPQILSDVQPLQLSLYQGRSFTYSVTASGTQPLYYQWLHNGTAVSGATASSYMVSTLAGTNTYSVVVSNTFGGGSINFRRYSHPGGRGPARAVLPRHDPGRPADGLLAFG